MTMSSNLPPLTHGKNESGLTTYHFWADPSWDGFDTLVQYMEKFWAAAVNQRSDEVYSRTWELTSNGVPIRVRHDSQAGNSFFRSDGIGDTALLDKIFEDLSQKLM